jgi:hypothetical protein
MHRVAHSVRAVHRPLAMSLLKRSVQKRKFAQVGRVTFIPTTPSAVLWLKATDSLASRQFRSISTTRKISADTPRTRHIFFEALLDGLQRTERRSIESPLDFMEWDVHRSLYSKFSWRATRRVTRRRRAYRSSQPREPKRPTRGGPISRDLGSRYQSHGVSNQAIPLGPPRSITKRAGPFGRMCTVIFCPRLNGGSYVSGSS